jgi:hypothetical protein
LLRHDRDAAAPFEHGVFDLIHPFESLQQPRRRQEVAVIDARFRRPLGWRHVIDWPLATIRLPEIDDVGVRRWSNRAYSPAIGASGQNAGDVPKRAGRSAAMGESERDDPIVYLATVANEPLASLYADVLQAAGIRSMAKPRGPGYGAWASAATLEHDLYVLRSRLADAEAIVRDLEDQTDDERDV